jgi:hypothetical protein
MYSTIHAALRSWYRRDWFIAEFVVSAALSKQVARALCPIVY